MTQVKVNSNEKPRRWYNGYKFPLIPVLQTKKANEHNTAGFSFHWLFFQAWTTDTPSFEISIVADTHWGVGVIGILPFLRWAFTIPCPQKVETFVYRKLSRGRNFYNSN